MARAAMYQRASENSHYSAKNTNHKHASTRAAAPKLIASTYLTLWPVTP